MAGSPAVVVAPAAPTCHPSTGEPRTIDFFVVSLGIERLLGGCRVLEGTSVKTHLPVALSLRV